MAGSAAPEFSLPATGGKTIALSDFAGRKLVIYFYPKDNTPGCTQEGLQFKELHAEFVRLGADILGVSRDSVKSHENFKAKMEFPFELISDPEELMCAAYGVMKLKNMYGKQVRGIERSTFVINEKGEISREWRGVKVPGHAREVLEFVATL
ncbi:peroxiredoxin [Niveibacterium umoris]|uniref:thioredoxin-dependent peroxiredoxin n=1 Tax=Niveibacterium umoris TaxID=1193620 RepID=A0A840BE77_9RHOO|nr:peroxiredoxin [Niveibacterium umoris]MBB4011405.1 peroxiredoxin Q/BCP [Niveibacterium umoris]